MANGIVIIDKPQGWTSMDVCAKLRGILKTKKIGHAGTLDPMATGVLPVFVGQATRAVSFAESGEKEYIAGLRLGLTTNTQDTQGEALSQTAVVCRRAAVEAYNGSDPTYGCIYYYNPAKTSNRFMLSRPIVITIGAHVFCK